MAGDEPETFREDLRSIKIRMSPVINTSSDMRAELNERWNIACHNFQLLLVYTRGQAVESCTQCWSNH